MNLNLEQPKILHEKTKHVFFQLVSYKENVIRMRRKHQQSKLMFPVSAPRSSSRFRGRTAIAVSTPLKVSERRRVDEKEALISTAVWTPIRLAVVPDISSEP